MVQCGEIPLVPIRVFICSETQFVTRDLRRELYAHFPVPGNGIKFVALAKRKIGKFRKFASLKVLRVM